MSHTERWWWFYWDCRLIAGSKTEIEKFIYFKGLGTMFFAFLNIEKPSVVD